MKITTMKNKETVPNTDSRLRSRAFRLLDDERAKDGVYESKLHLEKMVS